MYYRIIQEFISMSIRIRIRQTLYFQDDDMEAGHSAYVDKIA